MLLHIRPLARHFSQYMRFTKYEQIEQHRLFGMASTTNGVFSTVMAEADCPGSH